MQLYLNAGVFLSIFLAVVNRNLACSDVRYAGTYVRHRSVQISNYEGQIAVEKDQNSTIQIVQAEGGTSRSYLIRKHVNVPPSDYDAATIQAAAEASQKLPGNITSMCVAPMYSDEGLQCVDIDDAGITSLRPLRVDEDCNLTLGWMTYLEPMTPGCPVGDAQCAPAVSEGPVIRVGYSEADGVLLAESSAWHGAPHMLLVAFFAAVSAIPTMLMT